jgi:hypothetical protein
MEDNIFKTLVILNKTSPVQLVSLEDSKECEEILKKTIEQFLAGNITYLSFTDLVFNLHLIDSSQVEMLYILLRHQTALAYFANTFLKFVSNTSDTTPPHKLEPEAH